MPLVKPSPLTWTLRLKSHRTTILLHVSPTTPWSDIKAELLRALQQTSSNESSPTLNGQPLPSSANDVLFARLIDPNRPEAGWTSLGPEDLDAAENNDDDEELGDIDDELFGGGKGKAKATSAARQKQKQAGFRDCPQGCGLRENAIVAFRFRGAAPAAPSASSAAVGLGVHKGAVDDEGYVDEDMDDGAQPSREWDVVLPQFEDVYGINELEPDDELATPRARKVADFAGI
ncbi:hypothetical protein AAFC00_000477 [Neodothiora populina]|uniref:Uncharacterized protein n=1 Tax=Neodothiora populina TaxID=2781224 RepID=A0ABR3PD69_9PEZI